MVLHEEHLSKFEANNAQVLGISVDSIDSVREWAKALGGLSFPRMPVTCQQVRQSFRGLR